jgi:heme-degrading monooxygenase HmoA
MFARVSSYSVDDAGKLESGFESATGPLEGMEGFEGAYFLMDRTGGKAMSITLWATEDALTAGVEKANELRQNATAGGGGAIDSVDHYEVALTAGGVASA